MTWRIVPRHLKDVNLLRTVKHLKGLFHGRANILGASVGLSLMVEAALEAEHDLVSILGVLLEVVTNEMQGVGLWRAVKDGLMRVSMLHVNNFLGCQRRRLTPFQKFAPCSKAFFMIPTAVLGSVGAQGTERVINPYPTGPIGLLTMRVSAALPMLMLRIVSESRGVESDGDMAA
jgi:hypothetical protein